MSPWASNTTPEPRPELVRISTTDGRTRLMTLTSARWTAAAWPDGAVWTADAAWPGEVAADDDAAASAAVPWVAAGPELVHPARPSVTALASMNPPARVARPADFGGRCRCRRRISVTFGHPTI